VPFGRLDTAGGCALLPALAPDDGVSIREVLGCGERPLILLCTSWWQHEMMRVRETVDVPSLLAGYLQQLQGDWQLVHVGPQDLSFAQSLPGRYRRLPSMPPRQFEALVGAVDLVLTLNGSATTNTTAIASGTPVLWLAQHLTARSAEQLCAQLGGDLSAGVRAWVDRHAPLPRFSMWPMCMVEALAPLLDDTPYGRLLNPTQILDEEAVLAQLRVLLYDGERRDQEGQRGVSYIAQVAKLPGPFELVTRLCRSAG
jgi:hypothetical protein